MDALWHLQAVPPDPPAIGADAVIPPRSSPVSRLGSRLRLARARLRARGRLHAAAGVRMERGARVTAAPGARVRLGAGCFLGAGSRIEAAGGDVTVGARARLGERSVIVALAGVTLGDHAVLGEWAMVADAEPGFADADVPVRLQPVERVPVRIGAGARVGAHAKVLAGAAVAPGAVVASYAVVRGAREPVAAAPRRRS